MKAQIIGKMPPFTVQLDFNPEKVQVSRSASTGSRGSASPNGGRPAGATGSIFRRAPMSQITLGDVVLVGTDTKLRCDQLLNWLSPGGGLLGQVAGAALSAATGGQLNLATKLPQLTFMWGPPITGFMYDVVLRSVKISYERFDTQGIPLRAKLTITMQEEPSLLGMLPTNPTSGGVPGRRRHVVGQGDSLQSIAEQAYGSPSAWRQVAEANGVDDPLQLRPGDILYLPNPAEAAAGAPEAPR